MGNKKIGRKIVSGGITAPEGFVANGINCGIKKKRPDLGLIFSKEECIAVGTFTTNLVKAAPIILCKKNINNKINAIVVNSGIANACTGAKGLRDAEEINVFLAKLLNIKPSNILQLSTGVIGEYLSVSKIKNGLKKLIPSLDKKNHLNMGKAIMTTDTFPKEIAVEFEIKNKRVKIGGIAKGSGMISPKMATMLCIITTDVNIEKGLLNKILKQIVNKTFNRITIDGDMSTNDAAIMLANGCAENKIIKMKDEKEKKIFYENLYFVMDHLAKELVKDGEGATKFIKLKIDKINDEKKGEKIGFKIANSLLFKTAMYGGDANWGRVLASVGSVGIDFDIEKIIIKFGPYVLFKNGKPVKFSEVKVEKYLSQKEIEVSVILNEGENSLIIYTTDLTEEYIKINSKYRT